MRRTKKTVRKTSRKPAKKTKGLRPKGLRPKVKRYPRLVGKDRERASKYIAQERRAGRPIEQAVAIGISRVRAEKAKSRVMAIADKYL